MKVVIAPDSFKGNLSSIEVASYIASGVRNADPSIILWKQRRGASDNLFWHH